MKQTLTHVSLFLITFLTTTVAGMEWSHGSFIIFPNPEKPIDWLSWPVISEGLTYSICFLGVLTIHEFGHYFTARHYGINTSLPYYIPLWLGFTFSFGTMGAVIRIREKIHSRKEYFDVGISGPLAGFVAGIIILIYGFLNLPDLSHLFFHNPDYARFGEHYANYVYADMQYPVFKVGKNLLFLILESTLVEDPSIIPNGYEIIHYPIIFAGYLAMFFTALNLLPIGQLDGGHITFGLFGYSRSRLISAWLFTGFVFYAGLGWVTPFLPIDELGYLIPINLLLYYVIFSRMFSSRRDIALLAVSVFSTQFLLSYIFPGIEGYSGWLVFCFLIGRFLGVYHPPALDQRPLSPLRKILGWLALIVFILCFSPKPFIFEVPS